MVLSANGSIHSSDIYRAIVRNQAKLAYDSVAGWLRERADSTGNRCCRRSGRKHSITVPLSRKLKALRHLNGALDLETIEVRPVFDGEEL